MQKCTPAFFILMIMHWSQKYVGIDYTKLDCAELAVCVQQNEFSRNINLPTTREQGLRGVSNQITTLQNDFAEQVENPSEGDAVLMHSRGRLNHIGVYCLIDGVPYVLHAMRNIGQTCLHKMRDLNNLGLSIEGFYKWK